uniref:F-box domain-containing protein n=1 Tax=Hordeum vulgare subsp. vulgare TaxID=112509 RepID=A0A8I6WSQ3_HORVV
MNKAPRARTKLSLGGLPDEIVIWEILVRLSPKALLRCRAVCRAWCNATSTHDFLLAHHARQPILSLLQNGDDDILDIFDPRPTRVAADQFQSFDICGQNFLNLGDNFAFFDLVASCDGILILCIDAINYFVCNPVTRQYTRLPLHLRHKWTLLGMYPHSPTGEYRVLLYLHSHDADHKLVPGSYVLPLGSGQPPRHIGWPDAVDLEPVPHVLCRGNLHWYPSDIEWGDRTISVFDTTSESFRKMRAPVFTDCADLFEMDGVLGMAIFDYVKTVDIWLLQDFEREVWTFNCRVELPLQQIRMQFGRCDSRLSPKVVVVPGDDELLVLIKFHEWLFHVGKDGKLVTTFHRKQANPTHFQLKETLVPHTFFPTIPTP